jgi:hypothetical protein
MSPEPPLLPPTPSAGSASQPRGLYDLSRRELDAGRQRRLEQARGRSGGDAPFRHRKASEAHELLALEAVAPPGRLSVLTLDLHQDFRAMLALEVPVPRRPSPDGVLRVADRAVIGLVYRREAAFQALPGLAFLQILEPLDVFHPQAAPDGRFCLGPSLPAGIRVVNIVALAYAALAMQTVQLDQYDPAGLLDPEAAIFFQNHPSALPLTRRAFLEV